MAPRNDPLLNHNFLVEIDGVTSASFQAVEGIEACIAVEEVRNGNEVNSFRKIPGGKSFHNIILRRGLTKDMSLYTWFKQALNGQVVRCNGSIVLLDENRQPQMRFLFHDAWPCRLKNNDLNAKENGLEIEEIEIVIEDLEIEFQ